MRFSELCQIYDLLTLAESFGIKLRGTPDKKWGVCKFPQHVHGPNPTPSLSIFPYRGKQYFKCHGNCGLKGDVIDFMGYMSISGYDPKDIELKKQAADNLRGGRISIEPPRVSEKREALLPDFVWAEFLPIHERVAEYLHGRGFTDEEIERYKFGSCTTIDEHNRPKKSDKDMILSIPTFRFGTTIGVKLRKINAGKKYRYFSLPGSKGGLWNFDNVYGQVRPVLIAKGELCAALMNRYFLACSMTSGEAATDESLHKQIRAALAMAQRIYVSDNDAAGKSKGPLQADLLDAVLRYPPEKFKDWDEWYLARPVECVNETQKWIDEL